MSRQSARAWAYLLPTLVLVSIFLVWPLVQLIGLSFTNWDGYGAIRFVGFDSWRRLLDDPQFHTAARNTAVWTALSATVPLAFGFVFAIIFTRAGRFTGALGRAVVLVPCLLPIAVVGVVWKAIYNPLFGPVDTFMASVGLAHYEPDWLGNPRLALASLFVGMLWASAGLSALIFTAAIRSIDRSFFDVVRAEGGGLWAEIVRLIIPACRRSAALAAVVTVVLSSQTLDLLLVLNNSGGPNGATMMVPLDMYFRSVGGTSVGEGAAEACLLVALGLILSVLTLGLLRGRNEFSGEGRDSPAHASPWAVAVTAGVVVCTVLPLVWMSMAAFTAGDSAVLQPILVALSKPTLAPLQTAWNSDIGIGLWESFAVAIVVVSSTLLLSLPAAMGMRLLRRSRGVRAVILVVLVILLIQPGQTFDIPLSYVMLHIHLSDTPLGLVLAEIGRELPFATLLLWLAIEAMPAEILDLGEMDVGHSVTMLTRVVAPLIAPAATAVGLWVFVTSWSDLSLPTTILTMSDLRTAPMALRAFAGTHDTLFNLLGAATLLMVFPVLALFVLAYGPAGRGLRAIGKSLGG